PAVVVVRSTAEAATAAKRLARCGPAVLRRHGPRCRVPSGRAAIPVPSSGDRHRGRAGAWSIRDLPGPRDPRDEVVLRSEPLSAISGESWAISHEVGCSGGEIASNRQQPERSGDGTAAADMLTLRAQ